VALLKKVLFVLILISGFFTTACAVPEVRSGGREKIEVVATFYPLYDFTRQVGGERVAVSCLIPNGVEPHHWEPSPGDIITVKKADVFVYNGAGLEPWIDNVLRNIDPQKTVAVDTSAAISLLPAEEHEDEGHENAGEEEHGGYDPHIWLDPVNAQKQVEQIRDALIKADPAGREYYEENAGSYLTRLEELDRTFRETLARVPQKEIVTTHAAFNYLCRRYGLKQVPIMGLSPEAEPGPAKMAGIIKLVREKKIRYIFFETMVSPRVAEIIAAETGADTLVLNPVAGLTPEESARGEDYLTLMEQNLVNLKKALGGE
jgi:zinc transport system substrate-binding protein